MAGLLLCLPTPRAAARAARVPTFNQHSGWAEVVPCLSLIYSLKKNVALSLIWIKGKSYVGRGIVSSTSAH